LDSRYAGVIGGIANTGVIIVMEDDEDRCPASPMPALAEFGQSGDDWLGYFALSATSNVLDFTNPNGTDPGNVRVVWAANKTY
jgi:hypothetical protein